MARDEPAVNRNLSPQEFGHLFGQDRNLGRPQEFGDTSKLLRQALVTDGGRDTPDGLVDYAPQTKMLAVLAAHDTMAGDDEAAFYTEEIAATGRN